MLAKTVDDALDLGKGKMNFCFWRILKMSLMNAFNFSSCPAC